MTDTDHNPTDQPSEASTAQTAGETTEPPTSPLNPVWLARLSLGGALMGLANLVPGISGGTMLVATGTYRGFIDAISGATRLKLTPSVVTTLGVVVVSALAAIVLLSGAIAAALEGFRWGMYSLFIGLTLGGAPLMARLIRPFNRAAWIGLAIGAAVMTGLVLVQTLGGGGGASGSNPVMLGLAGVAGASAMILPGVSGAYMLLLLSQYETIINAIKATKDAASARDLGLIMDQMGVVIPVGIGVVLGIVVVGNILKWVLQHYEKATLAALLGLLIAAPAGLYPFREGVEPVPGDVIKGETVTEENLAEFLEDPKDWEQDLFTPSATQIAGSLALIAAGFFATLSIGRLGRGKS